MGGLIIFVSIASRTWSCPTATRQSLAVFGVALGCAALGFADDFIKIVKRRSLGPLGALEAARPVVLALGLWWVADHEVGLEPTLELADLRRQPRPRAGPLLRARLPRHRRRLERRQPDRRPRRPRGRLLRDRPARLHGDHLRHQRASRTSRCSRRAWSAPAIGFLWFNAFPASIFMGDTGSLGLGGAIGALAVMTQTEVLLIIIGGIFVIEALSVAIQVFAFKIFRRRVLLMAPLHHHFEMMAWSETKIMLRFWIIAAVCSGSASRCTSSSIGS